MQSAKIDNNNLWCQKSMVKIGEQGEGSDQEGLKGGFWDADILLFLQLGDVS